MCVQYEQSVRVSFFTCSQHCDNEFIWKYTLRAACACVRTHGCVCTCVHICTFCIHVDITFKHYFVCVCFGMCTPENVCVCVRDCVNMSGCRRRPISWCISEEVSIHTHTHLCVALLHQLITHSHTDTQTALLRS